MRGVQGDEHPKYVEYDTSIAMKTTTMKFNKTKVRIVLKLWSRTQILSSELSFDLEGP